MWWTREWLSFRDGRSHRVVIPHLHENYEDLTQEEIEYINSRTIIRSFSKIVRRHDMSREIKYRAPDGTPCIEDTRGILLRTPVRMTWHRYVGKEMPTLDTAEQIVGEWERTILGDDSSEWSATLITLREIGVRRIRTELDRTGSVVRNYLDSKYYYERNDRNRRTADYYRQKLDSATTTTTATRKSWTEKLVQFELGRSSRKSESDLTEPRITDSQLYRILKSETTRPGVNIRRRLTLLADQYNHGYILKPQTPADRK